MPARIVERVTLAAAARWRPEEKYCWQRPLGELSVTPWCNINTLYFVYTEVDSGNKYIIRQKAL